MGNASAPPVLVLMGVSGCGKTTIAQLLSERLDWPYIEGDSMHPVSNIEKMSAGYALTDADRQPWLEVLAQWIRERTASGTPGIVTCSALKRSYRDVLRGAPDQQGHGLDNVTFVYLKGSYELIAARIAARPHHFMPLSLLKSQFEVLEEPGEDENAITVGITGTAEQIEDEILTKLDGSVAGFGAAHS